MTAPVTDRRAARRQATREEIIAAAWDLVREEGLAGLNMRDLATRVGMKAPSLYSYFDSKLDIYDAMFHQGYLAFSAEIDRYEAELADANALEGAALLRHMSHIFFGFCTADPVRYQLLFQRTIPGFVPSQGSYAVAVAVLERTVEQLQRVGITDPAALDILTALNTGLTDQQISNDPGGDRWERLIDRSIDMFVAANAPHLLGGTKR